MASKLEEIRAKLPNANTYEHNIYKAILMPAPKVIEPNKIFPDKEDEPKILTFEKVYNDKGVYWELQTELPKREATTTERKAAYDAANEEINSIIADLYDYRDKLIGITLKEGGRKYDLIDFKLLGKEGIRHMMKSIVTQNDVIGPQIEEILGK